MDLILWRHAEAENGPNDLQRPLTARGLKQARAAARWLDLRLPEDARILCSPALRATQTAETIKRPFQIQESLSPGSTPKKLLESASWPKFEGTVVLISHQPTLGRTAALLLSGLNADWTFRKAALWWFTSRHRNDRTETILRAVIPPELA